MASLHRALVTGASGFIGTHLVGHLQRAGWSVSVLGRPESVQHVSLGQSGASFCYSGKTLDVIDAMTHAKPDVVFHLASMFLASHTPEQITSLIDSNITFGVQILEAMQVAECKVLVNAGTAWQNYTPNSPFDAPDYVPVNLYAATKQAFEDIARYYVEAASLRLITLRLFDSYGPGDKRSKLLRLLLASIKDGNSLAMSPGDQILDLVHVDDICAAFLHAAALGLSRIEAGAEVYAISGNDRKTVRETAALLERLAGKALSLRFGSRPYRFREVMHPWEGPPLPGWKPEISLERGLATLLRDETSG